MCAVRSNAGAQIMANRARRGFLRIGGTHGVAPLGDSSIGFKNESDNFSRAHEIGELAKKRTALVHGIKSAGFLFRQAHALHRNDFETSLMNARKNFTLLPG